MAHLSWSECGRPQILIWDQYGLVVRVQYEHVYDQYGIVVRIQLAHVYLSVRESLVVPL